MDRERGQEANDDEDDRMNGAAPTLPPQPIIRDFPLLA